LINGDDDVGERGIKGTENVKVIDGSNISFHSNTLKIHRTSIYIDA